MLNRYFEIDMDDTNLEEILSYCVESVPTPQRLDGTKGVVKLPLGYEGTPDCLSGYYELTNEEVNELVRNSDYLNFID